MISQNFVDDECICYKKFATHPPELVICPLHPCICLEAQNINCEYCESEIKRLNEEDDEEVEEVHAVWVYKKHPYKKRLVDFSKYKKR